MNVHNIVGFFSQSTREMIGLHIEGDEHAAVTERHHVLTFGPVGSENRVAFAYRRVVDGRVEARIVAGCWNGTVQQFRFCISDVYGREGDSPNQTHLRMYGAFSDAVRHREQQWRDEYEPPKHEPKAWIKNLHGDWHGYLESAKTRQNPNGYVTRFRDVPGHDAKAEAEAWLARQLADDEPKRCSVVSPSGNRCRMNEGHPTDEWGHYCARDAEGWCDHGGCVCVANHEDAHLLADGTEVPSEPTDDEPKRCPYVNPFGIRCRLNKGHEESRWHYFFSDSGGWCDYDGCVKRRNHHRDHLLADGTEVSA